MSNSPYANKEISEWENVTQDLIRKHPLYNVIVEMCLRSWESILNSKINTYLNLKIKSMNISPQSIGALLHDIIPEYIVRNTTGFRKGDNTEKDLICLTDQSFSLEIKTSSQKAIYGNRSYAKTDEGRVKSGYYLAINFDKLSIDDPKIKQIRFGWLDYSDWKAQKSETGQQASLNKDALKYKLITLYISD